MAKNLNIRALAWENLRQRPYRSFCLVFLVALFAFVLFGGTIFNAKLSYGLQSLAARLGADLLVVPSGYEKKAQAALLRGEPSTFYMKADLTEKLRQIPGVLQASPQFYLATLDSECCATPLQIIAYDPATDFMIQPWLLDKVTELGNSDLVVGSDIIYSYGVTLWFYGRSFNVVSQMEATGLGLDHSAFMSLPAVYNIIRNSGMIDLKLDPPEDYISSVSIKAESGISPAELGKTILKTLNDDYSLDVVVTEHLISDLAQRLGGISKTVYLAAAFIWLLAVLVLGLIFSLSLNERKREISILRTIGASRSFLVRLIMLEAFYISLGGALLGIVLASLVIFPFETHIFQNTGLPHLSLSIQGILVYALIPFFISLITGPLANIHAALSITRLDVYSTLREGE